MFNGIDLSSDTATKPSLGMRKAILNAEVGDEQKSEDPTTRQLQELIAEMLGFETALFFPSATMANQIAIRTLCEPGNELFGAANCHLFRSEAGGPAINGNVMCKPIYTESGIFNASDLEQCNPNLHGVHHPIPKLISVENTTNMGGGKYWRKEQLDNVISYAKDYKFKLHMDGARFFNASVASGLTPETITRGFDMVTICLSKGLGCPVGALLVFNKEYYEKVRLMKHLMGGAMRQSGMLAAAGLYALQHNIKHLQEDHEHAKLLAQGLSDNLPFIKVIDPVPETNIVLFEITSSKMSALDFQKMCINKGIRFSQVGHNRLRAVTHLGIMEEHIIHALERVREISEELQDKGINQT